MSSALTRRVFRQLLRNEPILHPRCRALTHRHVVRSFVSTPPKLFFDRIFGKPPKPKRELKPEVVDPGLRLMMELPKRQRLRARPPERAELLDAFAAFFNARAAFDPKNGLTPGLTNLHIDHALRTFRYLQETGEEGRSGLTTETLLQSLQVLSYIRTSKKQDRLAEPPRADLARLLYDEVVGLQGSSAIEDGSYDQTVGQAFVRLCGTLANHQPSSSSLEMLLRFARAGIVPIGTHDRAQMWRSACKIAAQLEDGSRLQEVVDLMTKEDCPFDAGHRIAIINVGRFNDDLDAIRRGYEQPIEETHKDEKLLEHLNSEVFMLAVSKGDLEFAERIVRPIVDTHAATDSWPERRQWYLILAWALVKGKSPEEVHELIEAGRKRVAAPYPPSKTGIIAPYNVLIRTATILNDSYKAERILGLASSKGCEFNATTYELIMDYRLNHGDVAGAREAYEKLQKYASNEEIEFSLANRLVLVMCQQNYDMQTIMTLVTDLIDRNANFDPPVVGALCRMHLERNELYDAIDLIRTHALRFTIEQRASLRDEVLQFCMGPNTTAVQTWDSYCILHELFSMETTRDSREKIMVRLFDMGRADAAVHVFGHLRQNHDPDMRPTAESYTLCFEGIANATNMEADQREDGGVEAGESMFRTVYNMLKLDQQVDLNTRLRNALMLAHNAIGRSHAALDVWEEIATSEEGPTYESIRIALMAAETSPFGINTAQEIWSNLKGLGVSITPELYASYVWAIASHQRIDEAFGMLKDMHRIIGRAPNINEIAICFNVVRDPELRKQLVERYEEDFPEEWEEVLKLPPKWTGTIVQMVTFDADRGIRS